MLTRAIKILRARSVEKDALRQALLCPQSALSFGIGAQTGPSIWESTDPEYTDQLNLRYHLFFAVDIPLLDIYVKPQ
jgi:hypothetical protein